mgnify:CR=1 FL=1
MDFRGRSRICCRHPLSPGEARTVPTRRFRLFRPFLRGGFAEKAEREVFRLLIGVSGIGASTARTMLSSLSPEEIQNAIISENVSTIQSIKGIGLKTAQRVIIDLKDKVGLVSEKNEISSNIYNTNQDEALSALEVLGYGRKQTTKIVQMLINESPEITVEQLIKGALNKL